MQKSPKNITYLLIILLISAMLSSCRVGQPPRSQLEQLEYTKVLRVGTLYSSRNFYYDQNDEPTGIDYELLHDFADYLGLKLKMIPLYSQSDLFNALKEQRVDLIAASLIPTPLQRLKFRFSPDFYDVNSVLVYQQGTPVPETIADVDQPIGVVSGSYHEYILRKLQRRYSTIKIEASDQVDDEELLRQVHQGTLMYAVVDDKILALTQRYYPKLATGLTLHQDESISWAIRLTQDDSFYSALIAFFGEKHSDGTIAKLVEKYFGHIEQFDYVDTRSFLRAVKTRLPSYESWFKLYADSLDWRLLAAVSYQESHWDPQARSHTGVRGLMMLTLNTAHHMGIDNRLDPEQSIKGGAAYLRRLISLVPDSIHEDEKIWFALAAYNMGFGHMLDARRVTQLQGANPNSWADVKERLPLLMQKQWYQKTQYGYARGNEAYNYVNNIRQYYQSLVLLDAQQRRLAMQLIRDIPEKESLQNQSEISQAK
ncbi:membrane-bound lytic murein transglycosylase MltF [Celerinatantimonas sp. YJH-8]|uniref:membrane-bound lytic murein transglycosylase MltF n=1 Tax=Celerinatantimonas sp. YJH-8 TaxID=3228714 RepID=UPI0038C4A68A